MFLSPPWGGPKYLNNNLYNLQEMGSSTVSMDGFKIFSVAKSVTPNIAFFVPKNTDYDQLQDLASGMNGELYLEQNVLNKKTKVLTAYYGRFAQK